MCVWVNIHKQNKSLVELKDIKVHENRNKIHNHIVCKLGITQLF